MEETNNRNCDPRSVFYLLFRLFFASRVAVCKGAKRPIVTKGKRGEQGGGGSPKKAVEQIGKPRT